MNQSKVISLIRMFSKKGEQITINPNHVFTDNLARDTYFTSNPTEKKKGTYISVGSGFQQWTGSAWIDKTSVLRGAKGDKGETGSTGPQGPQGIQGPKGDSGDTGAQGPQGIQGIQGETGPAGANGNVWRNGSGAPSNALGSDTDYYLNTDNGDVYKRATGTYSVVGNIKGATGNTGATGSTGADGSKWYNGIVAPNAGTGVNGDYYLDTVTGDVYNKVAGSWNNIGNIKGVKGDTGSQGIQGVKGDTGETGVQGIQGIQGIQGATGATGAGVASGGSTGQVLKKKSSTDYDTEWGLIEVLKPSTDGIAALKITKADGTTTIVTIDTTNGRIGIGVAPTVPLEVNGAVCSTGVAQIGGGYGIGFFSSGTTFAGQIYGKTTGLQFTNNAGADTILIKNDKNIEVIGNVKASAFDSYGTLSEYNSTGGIAVVGLSGTAYGYISAYSDAAGTGKNLILQKDGGKVGVGTTDPAELFDVNGNIKYKQAVGTVITNATATGTITPNFSTGDYFNYTLTGNITLANPTNMVAGTTKQFLLKQDATGSRTITYGTNYKFTTGADKALTTTANAEDILTVTCINGSTMQCTLMKAFS